ncbi:MAG: CvpA family protein [Pseudohongiellaceae bacterium]
MNQSLGLNWVDVIILAIVLVSCLFGLWRGLVREVFSLVTWVVAIVVARIYADYLAPLLTVFEGEMTRYVAAFAILFLATMIVGTLINHFLSKLITIAGLKFTDRLLGGVFGVVRGGIIVLLIIFFAGSFVASSPAWQQSRLIPYGIAMIDWSRIFVGDFTDTNAPL